MGLLKILSMAILLSGCASVTHVRISDYVTERVVDPRRIEIFFQTPPRKSRPIAIVAVARQGENAVHAVELLKEEAGRLGADAITNLDMNYTSGLFPNLRVTGMAVKYE